MSRNYLKTFIFYPMLMLSTGCWATSGDVETVVLPARDAVAKRLDRICGSLPGCREQRAFAFQNLTGIADGYYVARAGMTIRPGLFLNRDGSVRSTSCDWIPREAVEDITPRDFKDPLGSPEKQKVALTSEGVESDWSPFGLAGSQKRLASSRLETALDIGVGAIGFKGSSESTSVAAQLFRKRREHALSKSIDYELLSGCCRAYGCGDGFLVTEVAEWDRFARDFGTTRVDAAGAYLPLTANGQVDYSKGTFSHESITAFKVFPGFVKASIANDVCTLPSGTIPVNVDKPADMKIPFTCPPGFSWAPTGSAEVSGSNLVLKDVKAAFHPQQITLKLVATHKNYVKSGQPQGFQDVQLSFFAFRDESRKVSLNAIVDAARYTPQVYEKEPLKCADAAQEVTIEAVAPTINSGLEVKASAVWVADGSRLRPVNANFQGRKAMIVCASVQPNPLPACAGEAGSKIVEAIAMFEVAGDGVGTLATIPGRARIELGPGLACTNGK